MASEEETITPAGDDNAAAVATTTVGGSNERGGGPLGSRPKWYVPTVEPGVFLLTFAYGFHNVIGQNLLIDRSCRVNLDLPDAICDNLEVHKQFQESVQKAADVVNMYLAFLNAVPSIVVSLFIGPWSDRNGRKLVLILVAVGAMLSESIMLLLVYFEHARAEFLLLTSVGTWIGGGYSVFLMGAYAYASDISDKSTRTTRLAFIDASMSFGMPLGIFLSGLVYAKYGYYAIFGPCLIIYGITFLYFVVVVKETRGPRTHPSFRAVASMPALNTGDVDTRFSYFRYATSVFETFLKWRPNNLRRVVFSLVITLVFSMTIYTTGPIPYLYTRLKFDWEERQYTLWSAVAAFSSTLASAIFIPVASMRLKVHDAYMAILGATSGVAGNLVIAFASGPSMMYWGILGGLLAPTIGTLIRSMLTKAVSTGDIGKLFAFIACIESAWPMASTPLLTAIYNSSIDTFPGAVYLFIGSLFLVIAVVIVFVRYTLYKTGLPYGRLAADDHDEEEEDEADNGGEAGNAHPAYLPE